MTDQQAIEYAHKEGYSIPDFMAGVEYCLERTTRYMDNPVLVIDPSKTNMTKEDIIEAGNKCKSSIIPVSSAASTLWRSWDELPPKDPKFPTKSIRCLVRYIDKDDYEKSKGYAVPYYTEAYYWFGQEDQEGSIGWLPSVDDDEHFFKPDNYELDGGYMVSHWIPLSEISLKGDIVV